MVCPFATLVWVLPYPIVRRCMFVVNDHRTTWILCNNTTSRMVSKWYTFLVAPQFLIAPLLALAERDGIHRTVMGLIFGARVASTLLAKEIDKKYPYQRAVGFSHLVTFGPLFAWLVSMGFWKNESPSTGVRGAFLWLQLRVTGVCLLLDLKDVLFQLAGYPYPCYIREAVIHNKIKVKGDPRATKPVTWWNRIFGP